MKSIQIHIILFGLLLLTPHIHAADYPTANFSADVTSGPPPLTVQFTDLSTGDINYWEWDFDGDGVADSTEQDPSFIYNDEGTYTVSLYVSGRWGENKTTKAGYIEVKIVLAPGSPGTLKWEIATYTGITNPGTSSPSSPAISDDETIYTGSRDGNLYAIDPNGTIKWTYQTGTDDVANNPPSIDGDIIYIQASGYLYAVNSDGSLKWKKLIQENSYRSLLSIGPNGTIYLSSYANTFGLLSAINPDGTDKWAISSLSLLSAPIIDHQGNIYVNGPNLVKYNGEGSKLWELELSAQPVALGKHIYALAGRHLYAVNYDGTIAWEYIDQIDSIHSVVVGDNVLYLKIGWGQIYAISANTGFIQKKVWPNPYSVAKISTICSSTSTPVIGSNGTIYALRKDTLSAISLDGQEIWSYNSAVYSCPETSPIIHNNVLYLTGENRLYAINVESETIADTPWPMLQRDPQHTGRQDTDYTISGTGSSLPVYRFWSDVFRGHFFTASEEEKDRLICCDANWNYEGIAWYVYSDQEGDTAPIQRFWSDIFGHHFYTASASEKDQLECCDPNWNYEGSAWYAYTDGQPNTIKVYRFWSDVFRGHFFTTSETEKDHLICCDSNWTYEGIAYYALP